MQDARDTKPAEAKDMNSSHRYQRRYLSISLRSPTAVTIARVVCRQDEPASCLYVLISGRIRLIREDPGMRPRVRVEEEVGRGEAVGAVWALTGGIHDTTALCVRDSELVRMSKVGSGACALSVWVMRQCILLL